MYPPACYTDGQLNKRRLLYNNGLCATLCEYDHFYDVIHITYTAAMIRFLTQPRALIPGHRMFTLVSL